MRKLFPIILNWYIQLGKNHCGELRRTAFKLRELFQYLLCRRDYAERVVASFANQIKSE